MVFFIVVRFHDCDFMQIKNFLQSIANQYSDSEYCNIVGTASDMQYFVKKCKENHIWFYKVCTFCVYKGVYFKIVFCKKADESAINNLITNKDLVLNASNPF